MSESLEIVALGGLSLRRNGIPLPSLTYRKAEALLLYLATTRRPHSRDHLATLLWDDTGQERALNNLRVLLSHLRPHFAPFLSISRHTIAFIPTDNASFDVRDFDHKLQSLNQPGPPDLDLLRQAVELYRGDFLAGFFVRDAPAFEEWQNAERDRLQQEYLAALEVLLMADLAQGHYTRSATWSERVLQLDPLREVVHRRRMRALALAGQTGAALAQYERCRQVLASELDSQPSSETTALWEQIRSGQLKPSGSGAASQAGRQATSSQPVIVMEPSSERRAVLTFFEGYEVPDPGSFYGREAELARLRHWVCDERCRVVAVIGIGGMGKTTLIARLAAEVTDQFERVLWRSLVNAPPVDDVLREWLQILSSQQVQILPASLDEQLALLIGYLRQQRCLLVLDNLESILLPGDRAGSYREGYTGYGQLIDRIGQTRHISALILTTREQPLHLARLEGPTTPVHSLHLGGLPPAAGLAILQDRGLNAPGSELVTRYSGNPLALHLIGARIQDFFAGDMTAFLHREAPIFDDIRDVLEQQFARLSRFEQELIVWLAIEREPVSIATLVDDLMGYYGQRNVLEAVRSLKRRSLLEQHGAEFTLQNVVMEYTTEHLLATVLQELEIGRLDLFAHHALLKAQSKDYVRQSQVRLILGPLGERLHARLGIAGTAELLARSLAAVRSDAGLATSYAAGNLLNLMLHLGCDVQGYDFSGLGVWQVDLRGMYLPAINFAGADLSGSLFNDDFRLIHALAFSPDGRIVAGGASDGTIRLWRAADGQLAGIYSGHAGEVLGVAFSPDGCLLASGSDDRTVRVWDAGTGTIIHTLQAHELTILTVAFSPDGSILASCSWDGTICLWDVATGRLLRTLCGHTANIETIAFSPNGTILASGSWDHTGRLWNVDTGEELAIMRGHDDAFSCVAFSPDGTTLATGGWDHTVRLWNAGSGAPLRTLTGHTVGVVALVYSADGTTLASGSDDRTIRVWDAVTGDTLHTLHGHDHTILALASSPDGSTLVSTSADLTVRFWNVHTGQALRTLRGDRSWIQALRFADPDALLVSGNGAFTVRIWRAAVATSPGPNMTSGHMLHMLPGHTSWFGATAWGHDGRLLASASWDQTVRLWDARTGQALHILHGHQRPIVAVTVSPSGTLVASGSWDLTARLWDARTGQALHTLSGHSERVLCVAFSPNEQILASGGWDLSIRLWSVATGQVIGELSGYTGVVRALAFSPDGAMLASGGDDRIIHLWDYSAETALRMLQSHTDAIYALAWSPASDILASGSWDHTVRVWNARDGQLLHILAGHTACVRTIAFSPDGTLLASGSDDDSVRLWDVQTGACVQIIRAPQPYAGMNIGGATGLTDAQRAALKALGAVEEAVDTSR